MIQAAVIHGSENLLSLGFLGYFKFRGFRILYKLATPPLELYATERTANPAANPVESRSI